MNYLMLSEEERANGDQPKAERVIGIIKFYFSKFNKIQNMIKDSKIERKFFIIQ